MFKAFPAIVAATVIAGAITLFFPGFSPDVKASTVASGKSDRLDIVDCDRQSWPYYQRECIRDEEKNAGRATKVRIVTTDRIDITQPNHTAWPAWSASFTELQTALPASLRLTQ
jgi:hypothetical protein